MRKRALGCACLALLASGCTGLCQGPGCESSFGAAQLFWFTAPLPDAPLQVPSAAARPRWRGSAELDEGSNWSAAFVGAQVAIGQPEAQRVAVVDPAAGPAVDPVHTYFGGPRFGASLWVEPRGPQRFLWVGAPGEDRSRGAVYVFAEAPEGDAEPELVLEGASSEDQVGLSIVGCPDYTGDGVPEVLLGVPFLNPPEDGAPRLAGGVLVVQSELREGIEGRVAAASAGVTWTGEATGDGAGTALACDEQNIYVGAPWADRARGVVYVIPAVPLPASGALTEVAGQILEGRQRQDWFGASLASLGGSAEGSPTLALAVGAPGRGDGVGAAELFDVGSTLTFAADVLPQAGREVPDHFARALYAADLDGDSLDDLLVGSPDFRAGGEAFDAGRLDVWSGVTPWPGSLGSAERAHALVGSEPFRRVGRQVHVGDPDGDGLADLLVPTRAPSE